MVLRQKSHKVKVETIVENLTGEEILDPWLAMKGTHYALNPRAPLWRILKRHFDQQISLLFIDERMGAATTSQIFTNRPLTSPCAPARSSPDGDPEPRLCVQPVRAGNDHEQARGFRPLSVG